ncbi:MAG: TIGR01440 family protein [Peptococcaceae bacterium]|nr:TIGR01440 family protein [Peptococcaceae bacterium]
MKNQLTLMVTDFLSQAGVGAGDILVLGCSTSEICGTAIGKGFSQAVGDMVIDTVLSLLKDGQISLAVQCCEHLNRALVVEKELALANGWEIVAAVPMPEAGGAAAAAAFRKFTDPVLVEHISASCGIDIGDTFIGMHIRHVVVPVRLAEQTLGSAHVTFAKSRPKYIGGARACYQL